MLIIFMPIKRIPKPAMIWPICLTLFRLIKDIITTPMRTASGAIAVRLMAIITPVTVVPILAPMITPTAWAKFISPAFTKPTTITVVAEEL